MRIVSKSKFFQLHLLQIVISAFNTLRAIPSVDVDHHHHCGATWARGLKEPDSTVLKKGELEGGESKLKSTILIKMPSKA